MHRYTSALIAIAITLVAALAQLTGQITLADAIQLALLGINAVVIYLVPLIGARGQSTVKTIAAVLIAVLTALAPLITTGHLTGAQLVVVVLAGLQALGAHVGVQIRNGAHVLG